MSTVCSEEVVWLVPTERRAIGAPLARRRKQEALRRRLHAVERWVGRLCLRRRVGAASPEPWIHRLLLRARVLGRAPWSWRDVPTVQALPWGPQDDRHAYVQPAPGIDSPWLQAPVLHRDAYAPVVPPDAADRREHVGLNVQRYVGQLALHLPAAVWHSVMGPRVEVPDDESFVAILTETAAARYLEPVADAASFGDVAAAASHQVDFREATRGEPLPGLHVAPTVTLFAQVGRSWRVVAIRCGDEVFTPVDGDHWSLAKLFVMVGLQLEIVTHTHPRLHFPCDAVHAATRAFLPEGHLLARLLRPHAFLTLGLHEAVVHHRRSVLHNSQRELYTPFPLDADALHGNLVRGREGVRLDGVLAPSDTAYGAYLRAWFDHILDFVARIVDLIPADDPFVHRWADAVHEWLPDFPSGDEARGPTLARAVALVILTVSVAHTADHHSMSTVPTRRIPMRLRVPPPRRGEPVCVEPSALQTREDALRHELFRRMYAQPTVARSLDEVDYGFRHPAARYAARAFLAGMDRLDEAWAASRFPTSREVASSIQF